MAFGLFWLIWILVETVRLGLGGLALSLFTEMTPPPQAETGGLANAIFGSLMMVALATLLGTPIGILAGIYLAEYGQRSWLGAVDPVHQRHPAVGAVDRDRPVHLRRGRRPLKQLLGLAGVLALALIVIPVVIRTTENMLTLIPNALREAAYALGTPKWKVIMTITLKAARAGVVTGVLLALARIAGETAPLLFTALSNQFWTSDLERADGQPAGDDLQVRDEPVRELAEAGLGRRVPDHARRAAAQHPRARAVPQHESEKRTDGRPRSRSRPAGHRASRSCRCAT